MLHVDIADLSDDAYSAILRARTHYHIIRCHSRHPGVHAYYLETLLATQDPRLLDFVACDLSFLLRLFGFTDRLSAYNYVNPFMYLLSVFSPAYALSLRWNFDTRS